MSAAATAAFLLRGKVLICFCRKSEKCLALFAREIAVDIY